MKLLELLKAIDPICVTPFGAERIAPGAERNNKDEGTATCAMGHGNIADRDIESIHYRAQEVRPGGMFVAAFEDIAQLEQRNLNTEVFRLYSNNDVRNLLTNAWFSRGVSIESRAFGSSVLNCAIAIK